MTTNLECVSDATDELVSRCKQKNYRNEVTYERLRELLTYSEDTGEFRWRVNKGTKRAGDVAGGWHAGGYRLISIDGIQYLAHRLAILYTKGEFPPEDVDHINHDRSGNQLSNIRPATASGNARNRRVLKTNILGIKGVGLFRGKYYAQIKHPHGNKHLGYYDTPHEAAVAYQKAARELFGEFAHREDIDGLMRRCDAELEQQLKRPSFIARANRKSALGIRGVRRNKFKYLAVIRLGGKNVLIGSYGTPHEAALAYIGAAKKSMARLNTDQT